jgi:hypothetical protein
MIATIPDATWDLDRGWTAILPRKIRRRHYVWTDRRCRISPDLVSVSETRLMTGDMSYRLPIPVRGRVIEDDRLI